MRNLSLWPIFVAIEYLLYYARKRKSPITLNCRLDLIGEVLSREMKIRLLYFIHEGHKRPSELQRKIPGATRRVLAQQKLGSMNWFQKSYFPRYHPKLNIV